MKKAQNLFSKPARRILGFLMRNRGFQAIGKGVTLSGNDRRQSRRIHDLSQKDKIQNQTKPNPTN